MSGQANNNNNFAGLNMLANAAAQHQLPIMYGDAAAHPANQGVNAGQSVRHVEFGGVRLDPTPMTNVMPIGHDPTVPVAAPVYFNMRAPTWELIEWKRRLYLKSFGSTFMAVS